ncbi:hypothetical protein FHS31_002394 [Sphingomonas vulcanisoli]|uniref:DUF1134 domain-containing protein n=1 Tax=Sphingomonas vulcanisoli TaxID=1658060 RepID=A0ABX0TYD7_9SPHN|nr:DUF1134 domain-containing protein [Sphingomonas vulcanisoli]NIJ08770.1 hypothetical protein [Sphingomonas vulcanisoli]
MAGVKQISGWAAALLLAGAASAQVETIDPNTAASRASQAPARPAPHPAESGPPPAGNGQAPIASSTTTTTTTTVTAPQQDAAALASQASSNTGTYQQDDVLAAAEGVFGRGAEGLAKVIENTFKKNGRPDGYIVGREAGGAIVAGVRYGSGTLFHKVEGQRPVFWQGPSVGFDLGANGSKTFILVYHLYDTQELYKRFPAVEGSAYVIGGFTASYLRWHDVVLVPIRLGVGWRLGANLGYMRFTEKRKWSPF